ncbi:hypothetical protein SPFM20_00230 [Salmonella phage SPFM20]|nr:hypothetical protein SPFM8_00230 [Salmonella phage SPFM8]VFR14908.1 hypothetical protein SPFM20_00230 [Salmonella phage SPFM20]
MTRPNGLSDMIFRQMGTAHQTYTPDRRLLSYERTGSLGSRLLAAAYGRSGQGQWSVLLVSYMNDIHSTKQVAFYNESASFILDGKRRTVSTADSVQQVLYDEYPQVGFTFNMIHETLEAAAVVLPYFRMMGVIKNYMAKLTQNPVLVHDDEPYYQESLMFDNDQNFNLAEKFDGTQVQT